MAAIGLLAAFLPTFFASHVAAQNAVTPSSTGGGFSFGTATSVIGGGFSTATAFLHTATLGAHTGFGPSPTGPFNNNAVNNATRSTVTMVGIAVGIILGCYLIMLGIVLWVFVTRQRNRKAWYGPTAEFYRNGGRMSEFHGGQPLLGSAAKSFVTASESLAPSSTLYPALPYQRSPSPSTQYGSEVNYEYSNPSVQYPLSPTPQYDPNASYGLPYPQYYNPNTGPPNTGSTHLVIQV